MRILLLAALALPSLGMNCGPSASPPEPDDCASPGAEPVGSLAVGPERLWEQPFEAWGEEDTAYISYGPQGGQMLGVALELGGDAATDCLAQRTEVWQDGQLLVDQEVAIQTYPEAAGFRATNTLWLIFDDGAAPALGSELDVVTEAGGLSAAARLSVVSDRHRLVALAPLAATVRAGDIAELDLTSVHAPAYDSFEAVLSTSDPGVLALPAGGTMIYGELERLQIPTAGPGTAELVVSYRDQEARASITVE